MVSDLLLNEEYGKVCGEVSGRVVSGEYSVRWCAHVFMHVCYCIVCVWLDMVDMQCSLVRGAGVGLVHKGWSVFIGWSNR